MKNYFLLFLVLILSFFNAKSQINIEDKDIKSVYSNFLPFKSVEFIKSIAFKIFELSF